MYYEINLTNYEPKEVPEYQEFTNYNDIKWEQIEMIDKELDNFKDSFGKPWSEWTLTNLENRLQDGWSFYLVEGGWCFIDWNKKHPYLCNRYVMPEHRNKGLGSDLVWLRCNEVIKRGYKSASIMLESWNKPALKVMRQENIFYYTKLEDI
jgi:GNAT superfamily N-acetyltransferase